MRFAALVVAAAAALSACSGDDPDPASDESASTAASSPTTNQTGGDVTAPPATSPTTSTSPTTVGPAATTTVAQSADDLFDITQPVIDAAVCEPVWARAWGGPTISEYGIFWASAPDVSVQVMATDERAAGPFTMIQRWFEDPRESFGDTHEMIGGWDVAMNETERGVTSASWMIEDGSHGYIRATGIDRDTMIGLIASLTPRDPDDPVPGFDVLAAAIPGWRLDVDQFGYRRTTAASTMDCIDPDDGNRYSVVALEGDPLGEYSAVIDRHPPVDVGRVGETLIIVGGPPLTADPPRADDVYQADDDLWWYLTTEHPPYGPDRLIDLHQASLHGYSYGTPVDPTRLVTQFDELLGEMTHDTGWQPASNDYPCMADFRTMWWGDVRITIEGEKDPTVAGWSVGDPTAANETPLGNPPPTATPSGVMTFDGVGVGEERQRFGGLFYADAHELEDGSVVVGNGPLWSIVTFETDTATGMGAGIPDCYIEDGTQ